MTVLLDQRDVGLRVGEGLVGVARLLGGLASVSLKDCSSSSSSLRRHLFIAVTSGELLAQNFAEVPALVVHGLALFVELGVGVG
jgi:hypothetical protein